MDETPHQEGAAEQDDDTYLSQGGGKGGSTASDQFKRLRTPHVVPLGSIFVWSMESLILSVVYFGATAAVQDIFGSTMSPNQSPGSNPVNVVDLAFSMTLFAANAVNIVFHLFVTNTLNKRKDAEKAGGLHAAASASLCAATFLCCFTYMVLYIDSCVLSRPTVQTCSVLFRNTPMPHITGAAVSALLLVMFFITMVLSFVSTPQYATSYTFISKGNLLLATVLFGWAGIAAMSLGRAPRCVPAPSGSGTTTGNTTTGNTTTGNTTTGSTTTGGTTPPAFPMPVIHREIGVMFMCLCGAAIAVGAGAAAVQALKNDYGDDSDAFEKGGKEADDDRDDDEDDDDAVASRVVLAMSMLVNLGFVSVAVFAAGGQHFIPEILYPKEVDAKAVFSPGPVSTVFAVGTAGICVVWGLIDVLSDGLGCFASKSRAPSGGRGDDDGEGQQAATAVPPPEGGDDREGTVVMPPFQVMYMMDDRSYATMKKGDNMPRNPAAAAGGGHTHARVIPAAAAASIVPNRAGDSMFVSEDVRKYLRQRA